MKAESKRLKVFSLTIFFFFICFAFNLFFLDISLAGTLKRNKHKKFKRPYIRSSSAIVYDLRLDKVVYQKRPEKIKSIASITKLMTAIVVLDREQSLDERITISRRDKDTHKGTYSRLKVGTSLARSELLRLALMSSENRAAAALARSYPGGTRACVSAMNRKARKLGMRHTWFVDPTGLYEGNVSTALDLIKLVEESSQYPLIRIYTTAVSCQVPVGKKRRLQKYKNTNLLVKKESWDINISKTGYIKEAGRCLVMQSNIENRPYIIVLLDSVGRLSRIGDANRIKKWIERYGVQRLAKNRQGAGNV